MTTGGLQYAMSIIDRNFGVGISRARRETQSLDQATNRTNRSVRALGSDGEKSMAGLGDSIKKVAKAWLGWQTINKAIDFGKEIAEVTDKAEKLETKFGLNFGAGGSKQLEEIDKRSKALNLSIDSNREGFIGMATAMNGTGIAGKAQMDIYDGIATASAVMKLNGKDNIDLFESFGNVAKKGIVDFSGFKSEFATKIPGALKIAADAMGVSEKRLKEMMDNGEVSANKFLPKFADQIKSTFQGGLPEAANSMQASMNKKENALTNFWEKASELFGPGIQSLLNSGAQFINWFTDLMVTMEPVGQGIWNIIMALSPLWDALGVVASQFGTVGGNASGLGAILDGIATVISLVATGFGAFIELVAPLAPWLVGIIALQWAWNLALTANPIGVVVMAIAALIGGIVMAYQKIGWFRGSIMAAWEAIKGFAKAIKDYVVNRFKELLSGITGIGKAILLFFQGDFKGAWEAGKKAAGDLVGVDSKKKLINDLAETGKKSGAAYQKGMKEAAANNLADAAKKKPTTPGVDANNKFFDDYAAKTKTDGTIVPGADDKKKKGVSGGGNDGKHITFNIHSFVDKMTISSGNVLGSSPADIKREMMKVFNEIIGDLEVRVNG